MWDELPDELWLIVFWHLVDSKALVPAAGVCQRWRRLCRVTSDVRLDASARPWFKNIGGFYNVRDDTYTNVICWPAGAAKLRELKFAPSFSLMSMLRSVLPAPGFALLTRLDLSGTAISDFEMSSNNFPLLTHVNLRDCKALRRSYGLGTFVHLETITFAGCSLLTYLEPSTCYSLKTIDFTDCVSLETAYGFSAAHVMLAGCESFTDDGFLELFFGADGDHAVTHMNISGCHQITDIGALKQAPRLTHLDMSDCTQITDISVLQECTALTSVNLRGCTALVGAGNIAALANLSFEI